MTTLAGGSAKGTYAVGRGVRFVAPRCSAGQMDD